VPELATEGLLARTSELARRWALALVMAREPARMGDVALDAIARDGPLLCEALLHAVVSDAALEQLLGPADGSRGPDPARTLALLSAARDTAELVSAVEALRGVLWDELRVPASDLAGRRVADVCDRLAASCAVLLSAALSLPESAARPGGERDVHAEHEPRAHPGEVLVAARPERAVPGEGEGGGDGAMVVVDELPPRPRRAGPAGAGDASGRAVLVDEALAGQQGRDREPLGGALVSAPGGSGGGIEIRDQRATGGPSAWVDSISDALARFQAEGVPFAVLLLELERPAHGSAHARWWADPGLAGQVERAILREAHAEEPFPVRPVRDRGSVRCSLTRQDGGRYWLVVQGSDAAAARRLADRLAAAVEPLRMPAGTRRPALLTGVSLCPHDGVQAAALVAHADMSLQAARNLSGAGGSPPQLA
jgi:hypothetical protein